MQRGKTPVRKSHTFSSNASYPGPFTFALSDVFESEEIRKYKSLIHVAIAKLKVLIEAKKFLIEQKEEYTSTDFTLNELEYNIQSSVRMIETTFIIDNNIVDKINQIIVASNKKYNQYQRFLAETKLDKFRQLSNKMNENFKDAHRMLYESMKDLL